MDQLRAWVLVGLVVAGGCSQPAGSGAGGIGAGSAGAGGSPGSFAATGGWSASTGNIPPNEVSGTTISTGIGIMSPLDTSPVVLAPTPPPPLSGGTLMIASDGTTAVASDPDRDAVYWTSIPDPNHPFRTLSLSPGDEPGRVAQDKAGLIRVALRRGGAVVALDLASGTLVRRTPICPAPRGVAYDAFDDTVVVACVGGELVKLHAADDTIASRFTLDTDLRDVIPLGKGYLAVTRFRTAEVLLIDATGTVQSRTRPPTDATLDARVAWRAVPVPGSAGKIAVAHQIASTAVIDLSQPIAYAGNMMTPPVASAVTVFQFDLASPSAPPTTALTNLQGGLPVDLAFDASGAHLAVALYGSKEVVVDCPPSPNGLPANSCVSIPRVTGIAYDGAGRSVGFGREPAGFYFQYAYKNLQTALVQAASVADTGHELFNTEALQGTGLACASCHPEGREDGRVWQFNVGPRRTPSLVGGILATAPFHWQGELADIPALTSEIYTNRMGGLTEDAPHVAALSRFLDAIPRVPVSAPPASAAASLAHGQALFQDATVGCSGCHSGPHLTDNATVDVGLGQPFQVPTLVGVALRDPFMSNGCAPTLTERFGPCGGGDQHGHTSQLSASDVADLVGYLKSL